MNTSARNVHRRPIWAVLFTVSIALGVLVYDTTPAHAQLAKPSMTSPVNGNQYCSRSGTDFDASGTANAGYPVELVVNGAVENTTAPGTDGAYQFAVDRVPGSYALQVRQSDGTETVASDEVNVSVFGLSEVLGGLSRSPMAISPKNHDGYKDSTTFTVAALRGGRVRFQVYEGSNLVNSSSLFTVKAGSSVSWVWKGVGSSAYNGGALVPSGPYEARAVWSAGDDASCTFSRATSITVDNNAPNVAGYAASPNIFYPREDDELTEFKDTVSLAWRGLTEKAYVRVELFTKGAATPFKVITKGWVTGDGSVGWNGRRSDGSLYPAGTYEWRLRLGDSVGNVRRTLKKAFGLSTKRLDARSVTVTRNAEAYYDGFASGCASADNAESDWAEGTWLFALDCYEDAVLPDAVAVDYGFQMPTAPFYHSLTLRLYGYSVSSARLYTYARNYRTGGYDLWGSTDGGGGPRLRNLGTPADPARYIGPDGKVRAELFLYSPCDCADVEYDLRNVSATLTYGVLVP